jgi:hypothetical protein
MTEKTPDSMLKSITALQNGGPTEKGAKKRGLPPVHLWNPPFCGDLPMIIKRDGTWWYHGSPIGRKPMVRLFSTVLRKDDDDRFYLVTPVEKCGIEVEDAPFLAVEVIVQGVGQEQTLTFRTNVDDEVLAGPDAPIRVEIHPETEEPAPYVLVRAKLEAKITRSVFYELVELGVEFEGQLGVWSGGAFFPFGPMSGLKE